MRDAGRRRRGSRTRETCSPVRTARSRSATLCCLEPVKCWRRLPNWSGSTTRKSTAIPVWVRARPALSPGAELDSMTSSAAKACSSAGGSVGGGDDVEVLDRVGHAAGRCRRARRGPTPDGRAAPRRSRSPIGSARIARRAPRGARPTRAANAASIASSNFGPKPRTSRSRWSSAAVASASQRVDAQLVEQPPRALGPEPRQPRHVDEPRRELRAQLLDRRDRAGLEQREDLLLERLADARQLGDAPARASAATDVGASRTALAALR